MNKIDTYFTKILGNFNNTHIGFLDGVRAVAVLLVFFNHIWANSGIPFLDVCGKNLTSIFIFFLGHGGVNLFYLLSGFLLFTPYAKSYYLKSNSPNIQTYALKRTLRIIPAYYAAIIFYLIFIDKSLLHFSGIKTIFVNLFFLQNFYIFKLPIIIGVSWTLAIEIQFYLLLPFIAKFFNGNKWLFSFPIAIVITIIYRIVISFIYPYNSDSTLFLFRHWSEASILATIDNFAAGMILANLYQYKKIVNKDYLNVLVNPLKYLAPLFLIISFIILYKFDQYRIVSGLNVNWLLYVICFDIISYFVFSCFIFYMLFAGKSLLRNILNKTLIRTLGIIGYSFYLWHFTIIVMIKNIPWIVNSHGWVKFGKLAITAFPVVFVVSLIMYVFVEKFFINLYSAKSVEIYDDCITPQALTNSD